MDETVVTPFADEAASEKVLRLQDAYQGRAMFVKISCRTGEPPVELSHHPELRFRFTPRAKEGAPLIANSVSFEVRKSACIMNSVVPPPSALPRARIACCLERIAHFETIFRCSLHDSLQARDEVELLMRRDRAGCWICMDEVLAFETCEFEIMCEKEKWAAGKLVSVVSETSLAGDRSWSLDLSPVGNALGGGATPPTSRVSSPRSPELNEAAAGAFFLSTGCKLSLELCLVGTCAGNHIAMTQESALQAWKVMSPRSFVQQPSMGAIAEMCSSDSWSEEESESGGDSSDGRGSDGVNPSSSGAATPTNDAGEDGIMDTITVPCDDAASKANSPWSIVPWKGDMSMFDRAEVLRNVRKRYEDLMHEYHATSGEGVAASEDLFKGELTWFSAGIRIGVGVGLGVVLGLGLGVGVLVNGYKVSRERLGNMRQALRYPQ